MTVSTDYLITFNTHVIIFSFIALSLLIRRLWRFRYMIVSVIRLVSHHLHNHPILILKQSRVAQGRGREGGDAGCSECGRGSARS